MIAARQLTKRFGPILAADSVSFEARPGDVLGFLGPNGAGKSTTMKMVTGFLRPTSGTAEICGHDLKRAPLAARSVLGYLPETGPLYPEMKVVEFLAFIARIRRLDDLAAEAAIRRVREVCHLEEVMEQTIETLSKGFRQRVGLAQAILHDPPCLILDEPTDGLDPNQKQEVRDLISRMASEKTIILSTHILDDVEAMCNRVVLIHEGKILIDETPAEMARRHPAFNAIRILFASEEDAAAARPTFGAFPFVREVQTKGRSLILLPRDQKPILHPTIQATQSMNSPFLSITPMPNRLDEVFASITKP